MRILHLLKLASLLPLLACAPLAASAQDAAQMLLRIDRLEGQMRTLNGQLEQMQFQNRRLEEQLKKFQADVDFRLSQGGGSAPGQKPPRRGDAGETPVPIPNANPPSGSANAVPAVPQGTRRPPRGDAFDPTQQPNAPGAPRNLGTLNGSDIPGAQAGLPNNGVPNGLPNGPISLEGDDAPTAPIDLQGNPRRPQGSGDIPPAAAQRVTPGGTIIAAVPGIPGPREDFDAAQAQLKQGQYEAAEQGFRGFMQKYPRDRLTPDAIFYLGESYFQRRRHREAAEQFLKLSTDHAKAARAPEGMLRLGMSLNSLGAKEQACATFNEIPRRYPAATSVKRGAEREIERAKCL